MAALYNQIRPKLYKQVVGQDAVVRTLQQTLKNKSSHCFLFSGPSGVGKTTLARITAAKLNCELLEIDGATHSGADDMRRVANGLNFVPLNGHGGRAVIVDECHRLSATAWDSLLKPIEEPPAHVYWFLCTTNLGKVPTTIQTRALQLRLKPLPRTVLEQLVDTAAASAGITVEGSILDLIVAEAGGSARQALVNLDACRDAKDRAQAAALLRAVQETDAGLLLCQILAGYAKRETRWSSAMQCVTTLLEAGEDPEGVRIRICHYFAKAARGAEAAKAGAMLEKMEPFAYAFAQADAEPQLIRSIGMALLN